MPVHAANPYVVREYDLSVAGGGDTGTSTCVWTQKYDDTHHWEECSVHKTAGSYGTPPVAHTAGGVKGNKITHNKIIGGDTIHCEGIYPYPYRYCSCGWKANADDLKKQHVSNVWLQNSDEGYHYRKCDTCTHWFSHTPCKTSTGINLQMCGVTGTCEVCGFKYAADLTHRQYFNAPINSDILTCAACKQNVGVATHSYTTALGITNVTFDVTLTNGAKFKTDGRALNQSGVGVDKITYVINSVNYAANNTRVYGSYTATVTSEHLVDTVSFWINSLENNSAKAVRLYNNTRYDWLTPTYKAHSITPANSGITWSTQRDITVDFSDIGAANDYLEIGLFNSSGSQLVAYGQAVNKGSGNFSRTFRLVVDAPAAGANFILRARDRHNQVGEKIISLSYTDAVAPVVKSITGYSTTWTKTKTLRLTATELGSGNVEMAFDNVGDLCLATKSGNDYYRDFIFKGTVATPVKRNFIIKDTLGNQTVYQYDIGYLDNTIPGLTLTQSPDTTGSAWYKGDIIVTAVMDDTHSGIASLTVPSGCTPAGTVTLNGAKNATQTFVVRTPGTYSFTVTDVAGNTTTKTISVVKVDNVNPNMNAA